MYKDISSIKNKMPQKRNRFLEIKSMIVKTKHSEDGL